MNHRLESPKIKDPTLKKMSQQLFRNTRPPHVISHMESQITIERYFYTIRKNQQLKGIICRQPTDQASLVNYCLPSIYSPNSSLFNNRFHQVEDSLSQAHLV